MLNLGFDFKGMFFWFRPSYFVDKIILFPFLFRYSKERKQISLSK